MQKNNHLPDAIGLLILMAIVVVTAAFVPSSKIPGPLWIAIYFAWAAGALFVWYKLEIEWKRWPLIAAFSIGGAVLWYAATRAISNLTFGEGESELSKVFDLIVALILSPGITFIAIAGWVRELIRRKLTRSSPR